MIQALWANEQLAWVPAFNSPISLASPTPYLPF